MFIYRPNIKYNQCQLKNIKKNVKEVEELLSVMKLSLPLTTYNVNTTHGICTMLNNRKYVFYSTTSLTTEQV